MSFSHTNSVRYNYTGGVASVPTTITKTETAGAEMNISEQIVAALTPTNPILLPHFDFDLAVNAKSVYLRLDGFPSGTLKGGAGGTSTMKVLVDGEPFVWSYNNGTSFPVGNANPMVDGTASLSLVPPADTVPESTGTLTVSVLYDPV
jgi:hypothetical protein